MKLLDKIIAGLFYFLFFSVPLVLFPETSELFEFNKVILTYILTALITSAWLIKMTYQQEVIFRRTIFFWPLILFLASQFVSTLLSIDPRTSFFGFYGRFHQGLLVSICYFLLYFAFVSNLGKKEAAKALYSMLFAAFFVGLYATLQHFGIDKEVWVQDVQSRVFSTLGQPNWLAAFLVALIPPTWALALTKQKRAGRFFFAILGVFLYLNVLYTKSRSGLIGFGFAALLFWLTLYLKQKGLVKKNLQMIVVIFALLTLTSFLVGTPWTKQQTKTNLYTPLLEVGGTESGEIRKIVWKGALTIFKKHPLIGTGVETFGYAYVNSRPVEHNLVSEWDFLYNKAHNEYLNLAANSGLFGLLTHLAFLGAFLFFSAKHLLKSPLKERNDFLLLNGLFAGFLSLQISNFFGFSVVPTALQTYLFPALSLTLLNRKKVTQKNKVLLSKPQKAVVAFFLFLGALGVYFSLRLWYADYFYARARAMNDIGEYASAQKTIEKAIGLAGKEALYHDELAEALTGLALDELETDPEQAINFAFEAIHESDLAVSYSPRNVNLFRSRAFMFIELSVIDPIFLESAEVVILEAIRLAPTDAKLYYNLSLTQVRLGKVNEAMATLIETIALKPNYRDARLALGILFADTGQRQKAREEFDYILERINPEDELVKQQLDEL